MRWISKLHYGYREPFFSMRFTPGNFRIYNDPLPPYLPNSDKAISNFALSAPANSHIHHNVVNWIEM